MAKIFPWSEEYPFLSFEFKASTLPASTWALLGECSSKIEHVMGTPLRADIADELNCIFLAKGVHATTAIEGNTLTEKQVQRRVRGESLELPPTQEYLGREIDNIVSAYKHVVTQLRNGVPFHLSPDELRALNRMVLDGLELDEGVVPGEYRTGRVGVGDYRSPSAQHVEQMLDLGCTWLNEDVWNRKYAGTFAIPILRAILSHLYIAWIHPFGDGNGRTARLVEFDLLIRAGVPIVCAHLLSDYYNRTRAKYYKALSTARTGPVHFVCYAVEGLCDLLKEQIQLIRAQLMEVTWVNFVYSMFHKDEKSITAKRRREVALCLGSHRESVRPDEIPTLSPKLAEYYVARTPKTLRRDLIALVRMRLLRAAGGGKVQANRSLVMAFLPEKGAAVSREQVAPKVVEAP